jgi:hypothetical protein
VQFPITTVCLNHGKDEPRPRMTYRLIKLEEFTSDPVLQELLVMVGSGAYDDNKQAVQAATWNVTDKMGWDKLAAKQIEHVGGQPDEPYFSQSELSAAQQILAQAQAKARQRDKAKEETTVRKGRIPEKKI